MVLVEPAGPLNVGSVARLIANFSGPELAIRLHLVAPRCDHLGDEALRMAVHGRGVLEQAQLFDSLQQALAGCSRVVACTGRGEGEPLPVRDLEPALSWMHQDSAASAALVFGREDRGLSAFELLQAGCLLQIPTGPGYRSLNLSHAVAVVLQQWHQRVVGSAATPDPSSTALAPREQVEAMLGDAEELLLTVGFLYPHTAAARMAKLRALLQRAGLSPEEVALLRGMVRQCRWAAEHPCQTS